KFCADVCHAVMAPQADPHRLSAHAKIPCGECHIQPGARGYVQAKMRGAHETWHFLRKDYPRPIVVPNLDSVPDPKACVRCHNPVGHDVLSCEERVDRALAAGDLPADDPRLKKRLMDAAGQTDEIPAQGEYQEALRRLAVVVRDDPRLAGGRAESQPPLLYAA